MSNKGLKARQRYDALLLASGQRQTDIRCCADQRLYRLFSGGTSRNHADRARVTGIQELAWDSEAEAVPVL